MKNLVMMDEREERQKNEPDRVSSCCSNIRVFSNSLGVTDSYLFCGINSLRTLVVVKSEGPRTIRSLPKLRVEFFRLFLPACNKINRTSL